MVMMIMQAALAPATYLNTQLEEQMHRVMGNAMKVRRVARTALLTFQFELETRASKRFEFTGGRESGMQLAVRSATNSSTKAGAVRFDQLCQQRQSSMHST